MQTNMIRLIGCVDEEMLRHFVKAAAFLEKREVKEIPVYLHSEGGSAIIGIAISEHMRLCRLRGLTFTVMAIGECSSAATIILATADRRLITEETWVMVHEDSGKISGDISTMEREAEQKRRLENQWNNILAHFTGTSAKDWAALNKETTYFSAQDCLTYGLVDEIV
jgi:ATP-dependent Clp protease protease subunit